MTGLSWRALSQRTIHWAWRAAERAGAVTAGTPAGTRFAAFGPGSVLVFPPGAIFGEPWIAIGDGVQPPPRRTLSRPASGASPGYLPHSYRDSPGEPLLRA